MQADVRVVRRETMYCRWAYRVLSFGLLVGIVYRAVLRHEPAWDLLALVALGDVVTTLQWTARPGVARTRIVLAWLTLACATLIAASLVLLAS